jgi:TonB-linked SusC/RagA family outer membrane protein
MKKNCTGIPFPNFRQKRYYKFLLNMKVTLLLTMLATLQVSASLYSQNTKLTLDIKDKPLTEVIKTIEQQSTYRFFFSDNYRELKDLVTINVKDENISDVLNNLFVEKTLGFKVLENNIVVIAPAKVLQQQKISGTVTDMNTKDPLPGVNIIIEGTTIGVVTDIDGKYTINIPNPNAVLVFSFMGYLNENVSVMGKSVIDVQLSPDVKKLDEVVVVGYGTQKKVNLTGSVGNVPMENMESRPLTDASLALQGTVAGVYALQSSGKPGDDNAVINIRGVGTWTNSSPLVIIDGFPGNLSDVNANDIKSVSVLKDAASSSIYGNRAANGVILITTKKGSSGKMTVSYNGYIGVQNATRLPSVLNSVDYATLRNEAAVNAGVIPNYTEADIQKYAAHNDPMYPDIDYFKIYYGKANTQNHRLSITGGNENVQYAVMLGHLNQDGILVATNYKKSDFRSNIDAYFLKDKKLRVSAKLAGNLGIKGEPTSVWNATWYATLAPIYPLKNAAGQYMSVNGELNPYAEIMAGSTTKTKRYDFSGQAEAEYQIIKDLSVQVTYGYNVMSSNKNAFNANVVLANKDGSTKTETSDLGVTDETDVQTMLTTLLK